MRAIIGAVAAAFLTFACPGHAEVVSKDYRLVWLVSLDKDGTPLGALAFPNHMTLAACARQAERNFDENYTPFENAVGVYIAEALDTGNLDTGALCLTDPEIDSLVRGLKTQTDSSGREV